MAVDDVQNVGVRLDLGARLVVRQRALLPAPQTIYRFPNFMQNSALLGSAHT